MTIKPIHTERDYKSAIARIDALMDSKPGSAASDELDVLAELVERYEDKRFPVGLPHPIAAIRFRMEQQDLSQQDLVRYLGSRSKVSEVLNGKRPLSLTMIRSLHDGLGIPAEVLIQDNKIKRRQTERGGKSSRMGRPKRATRSSVVGSL